eukprot:g17054.t1
MSERVVLSWVRDALEYGIEHSSAKVQDRISENLPDIPSEIHLTDLCDGRILVALIQCIDIRLIRRGNAMALGRIAQFQGACRELGLTQQQMFSATDIVPEVKNGKQLLRCLQSLSECLDEELWKGPRIDAAFRQSFRQRPDGRDGVLASPHDLSDVGTDDSTSERGEFDPAPRQSSIHFRGRQMNRRAKGRRQLSSSSDENTPNPRNGATSDGFHSVSPGKDGGRETQLQTNGASPFSAPRSSGGSGGAAEGTSRLDVATPATLLGPADYDRDSLAYIPSNSEIASSNLDQVASSSQLPSASNMSSSSSSSILSSSTAQSLARQSQPTDRQRHAQHRRPKTKRHVTSLKSVFQGPEDVGEDQQSAAFLDAEEGLDVAAMTARFGGGNKSLKAGFGAASLVLPAAPPDEDSKSASEKMNQEDGAKEQAEKRENRAEAAPDSSTRPIGPPDGDRATAFTTGAQEEQTTNLHMKSASSTLGAEILEDLARAREEMSKAAEVVVEEGFTAATSRTQSLQVVGTDVYGQLEHRDQEAVGEGGPPPPSLAGVRAVLLERESVSGLPLLEQTQTQTRLRENVESILDNVLSDAASRSASAGAATGGGEVDADADGSCGGEIREGEEDVFEMDQVSAILDSVFDEAAGEAARGKIVDDLVDALFDEVVGAVAGGGGEVLLAATAVEKPHEHEVVAGDETEETNCKTGTDAEEQVPVQRAGMQEQAESRPAEPISLSGEDDDEEVHVDVVEEEVEAVAPEQQLPTPNCDSEAQAEQQAQASKAPEPDAGDDKNDREIFSPPVGKAANEEEAAVQGDAGAEDASSVLTEESVELDCKPNAPDVEEQEKERVPSNNPFRDPADAGVGDTEQGAIKPAGPEEHLPADKKRERDDLREQEQDPFVLPTKNPFASPVDGSRAGGIGLAASNSKNPFSFSTPAPPPPPAEHEEFFRSLKPPSSGRFGSAPQSGAGSPMSSMFSASPKNSPKQSPRWGEMSKLAGNAEGVNLLAPPSSAAPLSSWGRREQAPFQLGGVGGRILAETSVRRPIWVVPLFDCCLFCSVRVAAAAAVDPGPKSAMVGKPKVGNKYNLRSKDAGLLAEAANSGMELLPYDGKNVGTGATTAKAAPVVKREIKFKFVEKSDRKTEAWFSNVVGVLVMRGDDVGLYDEAAEFHKIAADSIEKYKSRMVASGRMAPEEGANANNEQTKRRAIEDTDGQPGSKTGGEQESTTTFARAASDPVYKETADQCGRVLRAAARDCADETIRQRRKYRCKLDFQEADVVFCTAEDVIIDAAYRKADDVAEYITGYRMEKLDYGGGRTTFLIDAAINAVVVVQHKLMRGWTQLTAADCKKIAHLLVWEMTKSMGLVEEKRKGIWLKVYETISAHLDPENRRPTNANEVWGKFLAVLMMPEIKGSQLLGCETVNCRMYFDEEGFSEDDEQGRPPIIKELKIATSETDASAVGGSDGEGDVKMKDVERTIHKFGPELSIEGPKIVQKQRDRPYRTIGLKPDRIRIRKEHVSENNPRNVVVPAGILLEEYLFPITVGNGAKDGRPKYVLPHGFHLMSVTQIMGGQSKGVGKGESRKKMMIQPGAVAGYFSACFDAQEESDEIPVFPQNLDPLVRAASVGDYVVGNLFWKRIQRTGKSVIATEPRLLRKVKDPRDVVHAHTTVFPDKPEDVEPMEELVRAGGGEVASMSFEDLKTEIEKISTQAIEKRIAPLENKVNAIEQGLQSLEEKTDRQHEAVSGQIRGLSTRIEENNNNIEQKIDASSKVNDEVLKILRGEGGAGAGHGTLAAAFIPITAQTKEFKRNMRANVLAVEEAMRTGASYSFAKGTAVAPMLRDQGTFYVNASAAVVGFEPNEATDNEISDVEFHENKSKAAGNGNVPMEGEDSY